MTTGLTKLKYLARLNADLLPETTRSDAIIQYVDFASASWATGQVLPRLLAFADAPSRARRRVRSGDSLVPTLVRPADERLPVLFADDEFEEMIFSTGFLAVRPNPHLVDARFLYYALRSTYVGHQLIPRAKGVTMVAFGQDEAGDVRIPVPSLDEQRRIADFLDAVSARTNEVLVANDRHRSLLGERWDSFVSQVVSGTEPGEATEHTGNPFVPLVQRGWRLSRLKNCATRVDVGIAEAATHAFVASGVPLIRSTNIRPNGLDMADVVYIDPSFANKNRRKRIYASDIVTVRTGNAGVSAVVPEEWAGSQTFTQLITSIATDHDPQFMCHCLNSPQGRRYFDSTSWGSAQRNISVPILANTPVPAPPLATQRGLARLLRSEKDQLTSLMAAMEQRATTWTERRSTLITAAITGQLNVATARAAL